MVEYLVRQRQRYAKRLSELASGNEELQTLGRTLLCEEESCEYARRKLIIGNEIASRGLEQYDSRIRASMNKEALKLHPEDPPKGLLERQRVGNKWSDELLEFGLKYIGDWETKWVNTIYLMVLVDTVDTNRPFSSAGLQTLTNLEIIDPGRFDGPYFKHFPVPDLDHLVYESVIYVPLNNGRSGSHNLERSHPNDPERMVKWYVEEFGIPRIATTCLDQSPFIGDLFEELGYDIKVINS